MNINNSTTYSNIVYKAIIVNDNYKEDPLNSGRVQIFIPNAQVNYINDYMNYMSDSNKSSSSEKNKYPWAVCLVQDVKNGDEVYVANINNSMYDYVVLGKAVYTPNNLGTIYSGNCNAVELLKLTMPIIMQEEVSINVKDYPDNISNDRYGKITCNDNGALSIGLIQWNDTRAHDCLYECCKKDSNWRDYWIDKNGDLYKSLDRSIADGSNDEHRKACSKRILTQGDNDYTSIYRTITSAGGKQAQLDLSSVDTQSNIDNIINKYGVTTPSLVIFLADAMNQYGSGLNYRNDIGSLKGSCDKAKEICVAGGTMEQQLDALVGWWKSNTSKYLPRRDRVVAYIKGLIKQGKLSDGNGDPTNVGPASTEQGVFIWPLSQHKVTSDKKMRTLNGKTREHKGIDLSARYVDVYASADGKVIDRTGVPGGGYGNRIVIAHSNGYCTLYAHLDQFKVNLGDNVKQGQVIAISGSSGNSQRGSYDPHLHFEIRKCSSMSNYFSTAAEYPLSYLSKDFKWSGASAYTDASGNKTPGWNWNLS